MNFCKDCREWHCVCELRRFMVENREEWRDAMREHRELCAKNDPAFQRFMAKVLNG